MEREQLDRLLAEYATGGLSEAEKTTAFTAALAIRTSSTSSWKRIHSAKPSKCPARATALSIPYRKNRSTPSPWPSRPAGAPCQERSRSRLRQPLWLAWASGIAIVLVSGAISYVAFDRPLPQEIAPSSRSCPAPKEFVPPPAPASSSNATPRPVIVEPPPRIMAGGAGPSAPPLPVNIPLPAAAAASREKADAVLSARVERPSRCRPGRAVPNQEAQLPTPCSPPASPNLSPIAPPRSKLKIPPLRRASANREPRRRPGNPPPAARSRVIATRVRCWRRRPGSIAKSEEGPRRQVKVALASPTRLASRRRWRLGRCPRRGQGRADGHARYPLHPASSANVVVTDPAGRRVTQRPGRPGIELELPVPVPTRPATAELTLTHHRRPPRLLP